MNSSLKAETATVKMIFGEYKSNVKKLIKKTQEKREFFSGEVFPHENRAKIGLIHSFNFRFCRGEQHIYKMFHGHLCIPICPYWPNGS